MAVDALARVIDALTGVCEDSLAPEAWWEHVLAPNPPPAKTRPRPVLDVRGVSVFNVVRLSPFQRVGPVPWLVILEARHVDGSTTPAHEIAPVEALELLAERGLWPWTAGDDAAPRWWCAACSGTGSVFAPMGESGRVDPCSACSTPCVVCAGAQWMQRHGDFRDPCHADGVVRNGHAAAPPALHDLVAAASNPRLREAVDLARELAGDSAATVVLRVMSTVEFAEHHECIDHGGAAGVVLAFSREVVTDWGEGRERWPEHCPYAGVTRLGGFGTPDDDRHGVHRAWPALRALAACDVHLLALDRGRVVLGVPEVGGG